MDGRQDDSVCTAYVDTAVCPRYSQYSEIQLEVCPFCEIQLLTVTVISRTARLTAAGRHVFDVCAIRRRSG